MLYKFLNAPFFACHLLGILLMGMCYDGFFNILRMRAAWLAAILTTYANNAAFALLITYVARYEHWVQGGFGRIIEHIAITGSLAAAACAVFVSASLRLRAAFPAPGRGSLIPRTATRLTAGLWVIGIVLGFLHLVPRL
ncbi:MAG: hypothetical protein FJ280_06770 [Planctomycetes bacterium]|nr:hypothetical protein [Planctomycetota bacterium]